MGGRGRPRKRKADDMTGAASTSKQTKHFRRFFTEIHCELSVYGSIEDAQPPKMNILEPTPMQTRPVPQRKQLFATTPKPAYVAVKQPSVTRPLGLVARDTNSPRNIVQSKQRRQVTKSLGGVRGRHNVNDKENMAI